MLQRPGNQKHVVWDVEGMDREDLSVSRLQKMITIRMMPAPSPLGRPRGGLTYRFSRAGNCPAVLREGA